MKAIARARFQRYGARKVGQVLGQIRGRTVRRVEEMLGFVPRAASGMVAKTLRSAAANLNIRLGRKADPGKVVVREAWAGQGPMGQMKRVMPAPQGRAMTFKRKVCHLTVVVEDIQ